MRQASSKRPIPMQSWLLSRKLSRRRRVKGWTLLGVSGASAFSVIVCSIWAFSLGRQAAKPQVWLRGRGKSRITRCLPRPTHLGSTPYSVPQRCRLNHGKHFRHCSHLYATSRTPPCSYFSGFKNKDVAFVHKPSKTLIEADLLFNMPALEQVCYLSLPADPRSLTPSSIRGHGSPVAFLSLVTLTLTPRLTSG